MNSGMKEDQKESPLPWERRAGDVAGDRVFQKAKTEDGPSCPLAAAAFCWRFSSVIPIQFYGLWEFIVQLHLRLLAGVEKVKIISKEEHLTEGRKGSIFYQLW